MRRIARLQRPSAAITQCLQQASASAPQHAAVCRPPATTSTIRAPRDFSTTPQRTFHGTRTREDKPKVGTVEEVTARVVEEGSAPEQQQQQDPAVPEQQTEAEARQAAEELLDSYEPAEAEALEVNTDLALPPDEITVAPRADTAKQEAADYIPAQHAQGLDIVGGLKGWFERDDHWGPTKRYTGFTPTNRVQDPALLELSVRRAVVEALAVSAGGAEEEALLAGLWERGEKEDAVRALGLGVEVTEGGDAKLVGDVEGVVRALRWDPEAPGSVASADEEVGRQRFTAEEAREIVQTWDKSWKGISLRDVRLKFAVCVYIFCFYFFALLFTSPSPSPSLPQTSSFLIATYGYCCWQRSRANTSHTPIQVTKRILQLTGHTIPDSKLHGINTAGNLVALLVKPPPATKVAEAIEQQGELNKLPNVEVHATRRTPVHKHQQVGRWKVIVEELEKRRMPATGDGGIGGFVEDKWFRGPRLPRSERKKRR